MWHWPIFVALLGDQLDKMHIATQFLPCNSNTPVWFFFRKQFQNIPKDACPLTFEKQALLGFINTVPKGGEKKASGFRGRISAVRNWHPCRAEDNNTGQARPLLLQRPEYTEQTRQDIWIRLCWHDGEAKVRERTDSRAQTIKGCILLITLKCKFNQAIIHCKD